jgi:hypothetical protein
MIKLALEMPTVKLAEWSMQTDLDFALAHRVLEDAAYTDFYLHRLENRTLLLDNSFHELGHPLPIDDLLHAAELVDADYIVSPDRLDDYEWTLKQFDALSRRTVRTAVVLGGDTPEARTRFIQEVRPAAMICLPYRRPRIEWFLEQRPPWSRVHLLGMSSFKEIQAWRWLLDDPRLQGIEVSVDTSKPIKWGLLGRSFLDDDDTRSLRNAPITSKDLLGLTDITQAQNETVKENIKFVKGLLT